MAVFGVWDGKVANHKGLCAKQSKPKASGGALGLHSGYAECLRGTVESVEAAIISNVVVPHFCKSYLESYTCNIPPNHVGNHFGLQKYTHIGRCIYIYTYVNYKFICILESMYICICIYARICTFACLLRAAVCFRITISTLLWL